MLLIYFVLNIQETRRLFLKWDTTYAPYNFALIIFYVAIAFLCAVLRFKEDHDAKLQIKKKKKSSVILNTFLQRV